MESTFNINRYLLILLLGLTSCKENTPPQPTQFTGIAMTMEWRAQIADPVIDAYKVEKLIKKIFRDVNRKYNRWNPKSEISKLNHLPAHTPVTLSHELYQFLQFTNQFVTLSEGRFDPTIEPLQTLWKKKLIRNEIPSDEEIEQLLPALGWHHIELNDGFFTKDHDLTSLDLGGIAKGFAVDLVIKALKEEGYNNIYFEWGGEIRALGRHSEGRPWIVWIARLKDTDPHNAIDFVKLEDEAIATSGDYEQFWVIRHPGGTDTTYFHVIDSTSGKPLIIAPNSIASVSVVAPTCAIADALATSALLCCTLEEAEAWAKKAQETYPTAKFWFVKH